MSDKSFMDWWNNNHQNLAFMSPIEKAMYTWEAARRWIPVSERLPDIHEEVLTYNVKYPEDGYEVEERISEDDWSTSLYVTHWHPLPTPPGEE